MLFLVLSDFKTVTAPKPTGDPLLPFGHMGFLSETGVFVAVLACLLVVAYLGLWIGGRRRARPEPERRRTPQRKPPRKPSRKQVGTPGPKSWILVDGSNVMHWQDNQPKFAPLAQVVQRLKSLGYAPGVVFDANAGWKLFGSYMNDRELARMIQLPVEQVLVVPKGSQADPFLLEAARDHNARIVTNDRYRDWAGTYPEVLEPGFLVRGQWQDEAVVLKGLDRAPVAEAGGSAEAETR